MRNKIFAAVIALLAFGLVGRAENGWDIQTSTSGSVTTFTISRTNTAVAETVKYRFVNLSAYAGEHYNVTKVNGTNSSALSGEFTFAAGDATSRTIQVTESAATTNAYKYQTGDKRSYKLEVTDVGGFYLTEKTRSFYTGIKVTSSEVFDIKHVTFQSSEYTANDDGYDKNGYKSVSSGSYCTSDTQAYLSFLNAQLCMTLSFDAKENDDAYEYLQLLVDNTSTCDNRSNCSNGDPGNISLSKYMAGFEMNTGDKDETYRSYTFPVLSAVNNEGATNPWGYGTKWPLSKQKFNGNRATDGRIIIPTGFSTLVLRLNASGSSGSDEWAVKNVMAHIQAVDTKAPTVLSYSVAPGMHAIGNTVYVSVAFGEIVTTSSAKLTSNWGDLSYVEGSGTNVLTFKRTIPDDASSNLNITGCSGIADLAGKAPSSVCTSNLCTLDDSYAYTITYDLDSGSADNPSTYTYETSTFTLNNPTRLGYYFDGWTGSNGSTPQTNVTITNHSHGDRTYTANWTEAWTGSGMQEDPYTISSTKGLDLLAQYVNSGNTCKDLFFQLDKDITYTHATAWNDATSTENNYTRIGNGGVGFEGTFDGQNHTISGIRMYKGGSNPDYDSGLGLFGGVRNGGIVKRVNLSNSRITGFHRVAGIAGQSFNATIEDCTVGEDVCIYAVKNNAKEHGGIVGYNEASVLRCISSATLTMATILTNCYNFGGIVGFSIGDITNCIVDGAVIPAVKGRGAIVGYKSAGTLTRNYYRGCTVAGVENATGVGLGTSQSSTETTDVSGARAVYAITLPENASLVRSAAITLPGTGNKTYTTGADIDGVPYAYDGASLTLSYNAASIPSGYDLSSITIKYTSGSTVVDVTRSGDYTFNFTMPAADVTVTATLLPVISYIDADGNEQSHMCTPITTSSAQYGNAANAEGWYCVNSDVAFDNYIEFQDQAVHIILCDGFTLTGDTAKNHRSITANNGSLTIYGQTFGTGTLSLRNRNYAAIFAATNIDFNGGIINAASQNFTCLSAGNNIIIRRGNITATGGAQSSGISATTITLGCATTADRIWASRYNGTVVVADGQTLTDGDSAHTYTGTLTDNQKAAIRGRTMMKALGDVSYIDENGLAQTCSEYKILSDGILSPTLYTIGKTGYDTWYVASGNYTFNTTQLNTQGHVHLIFCDGANFTVTGNSYGINATDDLTIYGQSQATGTLTANVENASGKALYVSPGNLVVNGGVVSAHGGEYGIYVNNGNLTVGGGSINATGTTSGIHVEGNLTLGWTNTSDRITASSYSCTGTISIRDNQIFHNGTQFLGGIIGDLSKLNGKTLTPFAAPSPNLTLVQGSKDGITAYWGTFYDSAADYSLPEGASAYTMDADYHLYRLGVDGNVIPKGTAVVILGKEAAVTLTLLYEVPDVTDHAPGGNILMGQDVDAVINGICVLSKNASGAVGFYPLSGSALPAHKAGYVPKGLLDYHKEDGQQW
jgi:uncharacterized repeat protein (TIGR02543 family)